LTAGDKILYSIPVLMLTFADSTAALIGLSYGRNGLATATEDPKSIEGSFAFFWAAFMSTLVPVLLYTNIGRAESLLLSLIIGLLVALIEMISSGGYDNLFIPLMGYAFLISHMPLPCGRN
jgi:phytol kinase